MTVFSLASLIAVDAALHLGAGQNAAHRAAGGWGFRRVWAVGEVRLLVVAGAAGGDGRGPGCSRRARARCAALAAGFAPMPWLAAGFAVGNAPMLLFNLLGAATGAGAPTLNLLLGSLATPTHYGW